MDLDPAKVQQAAEAYRQFCDIVGISTNTSDTNQTPQRVAKLMLGEFTKGLRPMDFTFTTFDSPANETMLVSVLGIRFSSLCAHHHLPFKGTCHIGYLPAAKRAGLSKMPRLVDWLSAQPTMQESLCSAVLKGMVDNLAPRFAIVNLIADHSCMSCRGCHQDAQTVTEAYYSDQPNQPGAYSDTRAEFARALAQWKP